MNIVHADFEPSAYGTLVLDGAGHILRSNVATVNFTSTEAKIFTALISSGASGLCVTDIPVLLGYDVSNRSIQLVRAHISHIRKKIFLSSDISISLITVEDQRRYAIIPSVI